MSSGARVVSVYPNQARPNFARFAALFPGRVLLHQLILNGINSLGADISDVSDIFEVFVVIATTVLACCFTIAPSTEMRRLV